MTIQEVLENLYESDTIKVPKQPEVTADNLENDKPVDRIFGQEDLLKTAHHLVLKELKRAKPCCQYRKPNLNRRL